MEENEKLQNLLLQRTRLLKNSISQIEEQALPKEFLSDKLALISLHFETIGLLKFLLNEDIISFKTNLHCSCIIKRRLYEVYDSNLFKVDPSYVTMKGFKELLSLTVVDNKMETINFANIIGGRHKEEKNFDTPLFIHLGYAIKYLILNDFDSCSKHIENLRKLRTFNVNKPHFGLIDALSSIYLKDNHKFNDALLLMIQTQKRKRDVGLIDKKISLLGLGIARLGIEQGLLINIKNPLLPLELLESKEHTDFPSFEDIIKIN